MITEMLMYVELIKWCIFQTWAP